MGQLISFKQYSRLAELDASGSARFGIRGAGYLVRDDGRALRDIRLCLNDLTLCQLRTD